MPARAGGSLSPSATAGSACPIKAIKPAVARCRGLELLVEGQDDRALARKIAIEEPHARMVEMGAFFLRTDAELILKSRRVVPGRLLEEGFSFEFPEWPSAAADLVARWGEGGQPSPVARVRKTA